MCIPLAVTGVPGAGSASLPGAGRLDIASLEGTLHQFLEVGLSNSTRRVYRAGWNRFLSFTRAFSLPATPITTESAILFAAYLGSEGLAVSTIESYLAALRHFRVIADPHCTLPTFHSPYMKVLLHGIRRVQAQQAPARVRLPITASLMRRIKAQLSLPPASYLKVLIWAACSIGFFGFLRAGEFLVPDGAQFDPSRHLSLSDINLVTSAPQWHFLVTIKASKTDQFFQGGQVVLGATGSDLCPVEALLGSDLSSRGPAPGPLFILPDGGPLRRPQFVEEVQQALSASGLVGLNFNSHRFRIGAATPTGAAGVPESTIKVLGRWKSMAYQRYIRPSMEDRAQVSSQLC